LSDLQSVSNQEQWALERHRRAERFARGVLYRMGVASYLIDDLAADTAQEATMALVGRLRRIGPVVVGDEDDLCRYWKQVVGRKAKELRARRYNQPQTKSLDGDEGDESTAPVIVGVVDRGLDLVELAAAGSPRLLLRRSLVARFRAGIIDLDGGRPLSVKEGANVNAGRVMAVALAVVAELPADAETDEVLRVVEALLAEPHASADVVDVDHQLDLVRRAHPGYFSDPDTDSNTKAKTKQRIWTPARALLHDAARAAVGLIGPYANEDGTR